MSVSSRDVIIDVRLHVSRASQNGVLYYVAKLAVLKSLIAYNVCYADLCPMGYGPKCDTIVKDCTIGPYDRSTSEGHVAVADDVSASLALGKIQGYSSILR